MKKPESEAIRLLQILKEITYPAKGYENCGSCPLYSFFTDYLGENGLFSYMDREFAADVARYCERCQPGSWEKYERISDLVSGIKEIAMKNGPESAMKRLQASLYLTSMGDERKGEIMDMLRTSLKKTPSDIKGTC